MGRGENQVIFGKTDKIMTYKMDPNKSGVMIYFEPMREEANNMDDIRLGKLFRAILNYADPHSETEPTFEDETLTHVWRFVRSNVIRDDKTYRTKSAIKQYAAFCRYAKDNGIYPPPIPRERWLELGRPTFAQWQADTKAQWLASQNQNAGAMQCNADVCSAMHRSADVCASMPTTSSLSTSISSTPTTSTPVSVSADEQEVPALRLPPALYDALTHWIMHWEEVSHKVFGNSSRYALTSEFRDYADEYGAEAVIKLVREAISSGYKSIPWDRLERGRGQASGQNPEDELRALQEKFREEETRI